MSSFASYAFGCRVNQAEKEELDRQLVKKGFVWNQDLPDYFIINSCAVTQKAEREVRQKIYQIRKKFPQTKIIVTGCSATKWIKERRLIKEVDQLVDNIDKEYLAELLCSYVISNEVRDLAKCSSIKDTNDPSDLDFSPSSDWVRNDNVKARSDVRNKFLNSGRLLVKIQEGCHRFCTYCIVPYLRGRPKSKRIDQIVNEIKLFSCHSRESGNLTDPRVKPEDDNKKIPGQTVNNNINKEVILTAVNTESFGMDTGETVTGLLKNILAKTRIPRISWGSINPWSVTDEFIKFYLKNLPSGRLVKFFHIPVQSGSDKILRLMKRGYTSIEIFDKLVQLVQLDKFTLISTDIIVGFPGETESDFTQTYEFLRKSPINKFHIFRYSPREGTASYYMVKELTPVDSATKIKRAKILEALGNLKYRKFIKNLVGRTFLALFLEKRNGNFQEALLDNQVRIMVKTNIDPGIIKDIVINKFIRDQLLGIIIK